MAQLVESVSTRWCTFLLLGAWAVLDLAVHHHLRSACTYKSTSLFSGTRAQHRSVAPTVAHAELAQGYAGIDSLPPFEATRIHQLAAGTAEGLIDDGRGREEAVRHAGFRVRH